MFCLQEKKIMKKKNSFGKKRCSFIRFYFILDEISSKEIYVEEEYLLHAVRDI